MPRAVTTTDTFLEEISGKLDKIVDLLEPSRPEPPPSEPAPADAPAEKPALKAPAKKTARKRVTGQ